MADAVLSTIVTEIVNKLGSVALQEIQLACGVKNEACKLGNTVSTIKAVLLDAQEKQATNHEVQDWLEKLNDAVYDANDLLDDFSTEALRWKVMTQNKRAKKVRIFFSSSNQLLFSLKMGHRVKAIRERLDAIGEDKNKFHFTEQPLEMRADQMRIKRETHSFVCEDKVIGRDDDKKAIVELLMDCNVQENISIVTIVGIGGLGKTELAKLVYNDLNVTEHFECKMWVCVSDIFDVKQIAEKIVESGIGRKPESLHMEGVQNDLRREIDGKKYLLVLDDVWNEDVEQWIRLRDLLMGGAKGSKILITTRTKLVATVTETNSLYPLKGLPEKESWSLFKQMAFKEGKEPDNPCLVKIGKEIVEKCAGVPLAIRVLGSLLRSKDTVNEWLNIRNKNMSKIAQEENNILPILKLSYDQLPWDLKQCFAFCRLYPKDHVIVKQQLTQLWIAHGFIQSSNENQDMEDIGDSYFMNLLRRSFFQDEEIDEFGNIICCKMHDLMNDLAQSVAGTESSMVNLETKDVSQRTRHVSFDCGIYSLREITPLLRSIKIRTFFLPVQGLSYYTSLDSSVCERIISTFKLVRVLDMHCLGLETVPSCISELRHLRYLDLSYNGMIKGLPNSIIKLQNLQTLKLTRCKNLIELPRDMRKLVSLRHLELGGCSALTDMPRGLGELTCLRTLKPFIMGPGNSLSELKGLNNLRGELAIGPPEEQPSVTWRPRWMSETRGPIGVIAIGGRAIAVRRSVLTRATPKEAEEANLKGKEYLQYLKLNFNQFHGDGKLELVLEALQPHANLKKLEICFYGGVRLPTWMSSLPNVVEIVLHRCKGCKHLPKLEHLPSLQTLDLSILSSVEYIDDDYICGGRRETTTTTRTFFPSLKRLRLYDLRNLKGWWRSKKHPFHRLLPSFPCLHQSEIWNCPKLTSMPLQPTVETLKLQGVNKKVVQQQLRVPLSNLEELKIFSIKDLITLPEEAFQCLTSLRVLQISECPRLTSLSGGMRHLTALQSLKIDKCQVLDLSSGDDDGMHFQGLGNLTSLDIHHNTKLESLPAGLQHVTSLQHLSISFCENLISLPEWIGNLTSLQQLQIECLRLTSLPKGMRWLTALQKLEICPCLQELEERCCFETGEDWPKIAHIPEVQIGRFYL